MDLMPDNSNVKLAEALVSRIEDMPDASSASLIELVERHFDAEGAGWVYDKKRASRALLDPNTGEALVFDNDLFAILAAVYYFASKRGIELDCGGVGDVGLPFNLPLTVWHENDELSHPDPFHICVLHHPLRGCEYWDTMEPSDDEIDTAYVVWSGEGDNGVITVQSDHESVRPSFTFNVQPTDEGETYATAVFLPDGRIQTIGLAGSGEPFTISEPLCDAMEESTVIASSEPIDIDEVMAADGYRKEGSAYLNVEEERERAEFLEGI